MNRRQFLSTIPAAAAAAVAALPALAETPEVFPYVDMGSLDMSFVYFKRTGIYYFRTLHRRDDGQVYRGPFPGVEIEGPYQADELIDWFRPS